MLVRLVFAVVLVLLTTVACRPSTFMVPADTAPTASPSPASAETSGTPPGAGSLPGPVIVLAALANDDLLAGVGPIGDPDTGLAWQLYRGRPGRWQRLAWPDEAIPRVFRVTPTGDTLFVVPLSNAVFGAGQPWGLMRSLDGGRSWQQALNGLDDPYVMDVAMSPAYATDRTLVAVTWYDGTFFSTDGGDSWQRLPYRQAIEPSGGANPYDLAVALSPDFRSGTARAVDQGSVCASFGHRLHLWSAARQGWRTTEFTVTARSEAYEPQTAQLTAGAIVFSPSFTDDGTLYVYSGYAGLFRSTDRGETWRLAGRRLPAASPPTSAFHLEVASATELYVLLPVGQTGEDGSGGADATSKQILHRTRDGGVTWQVLEAPPAVGEVTALAAGRDEQGRVVLHLGGRHGGVSSDLADVLTWD
jgi:hypothetical protein